MASERKQRLFEKDSRNKLRAYIKKHNAGKTPPGYNPRSMSRATYLDLAKNARQNIERAKEMKRRFKSY